METIRYEVVIKTVMLPEYVEVERNHSSYLESFADVTWWLNHNMRKGDTASVIAFCISEDKEVWRNEIAWYAFATDNGGIRKL